MFKSESSYWPGGEEVKGWKGNIKAIEDYVKEHGAGFEMGDSEKTMKPELGGSAMLTRALL